MLSADRNEWRIRHQAEEARDLIDRKLVEAGWAVQSKDGIDLNAVRGVAIREHTSDTGPMDYMLMVDGRPCGVIEAKKTEEAHKLSTVEEGRPRALVQMATGSGKAFTATFARDKEN